ncbi:hypothetical protein J2T16_005434 [Paenibacillus intestini]|nr:hypothetical protein [Paenibacillus intestini]
MWMVPPAAGCSQVSLNRFGPAAVKTREQRRTLRSFVNHSTPTPHPAALFFKGLNPLRCSAGSKSGGLGTLASVWMVPPAAACSPVFLIRFGPRCGQNPGNKGGRSAPS